LDMQKRNRNSKQRQGREPEIWSRAVHISGAIGVSKSLTQIAGLVGVEMPCSPTQRNVGADATSVRK
jgi:hypothetical protein